jgi:hypothetical protein
VDYTPTVLVFALDAILSLIPAEIARRKGYSFAGWWLFGMVIWIVALPAAVLVGESPTTRRCPHCRELISVWASACPKCGRDVPAVPASSVQRAPAPAWAVRGVVGLGVVALGLTGYVILTI